MFLCVYYTIEKPFETFQAHLSPNLDPKNSLSLPHFSFLFSFSLLVRLETPKSSAQELHFRPSPVFAQRTKVDHIFELFDFNRLEFRLDSVWIIIFQTIRSSLRGSSKLYYRPIIFIVMMLRCD